MQNFTDYKNSLSLSSLPDTMSVYLKALWHDAKGDWDKAHNIIQDVPDKTASWIHAYLHRKEGDLANAAYWYDRARQPVATDPLPAEWERIVTALLHR